MVYCFELCDRAMHCGENALAEVATHLKEAKKQKRQEGMGWQTPAASRAHP